jgi:hypothetical protein
VSTSAPRGAAGSGSPPAAPQPRHADLDGDESVPLGCPKCNAPMQPNDDLCDACGYHLILKKVIDISDMKKRSTATGFERMLEGQLHDSETSRGALLWLKIVAGLVLLGVMFLCLGRFWWIGVLAAGAGWVFYWARSRSRAAQAPGQSQVNQDPLSTLLWSALLSLQRTVGWRRLEWPFPKARALMLCDPKFTDDELSELKGLDELEVLDLEGTGITDAGLEHLRGRKELRFLVLRRTGVTSAGAANLQRELPQTLIWF